MGDYRLDPLQFFDSNGGLCIFACITEHQEIRSLAVERIERLQVTDNPFEYPQNFDPEKLLRSAFEIIFDRPFQVRMRFSREVAPCIREHTWTANQRIVENESNGSIILEKESSGSFDIKRWAMSHGMHAKVQ